MSRPTVWAVKEQMRRDASGASVPMDYSPVYKYGDLQFITHFDPPIYARPVRPNHAGVMDEWGAQVKSFLEQFDASRDFIVLTGAPIATFVVGMLVGWSGIQPKVLVWRRERNTYDVFDTREQLGDLILKLNSNLIV